MAEKRERPRAVLFDRDGTLVVDVPYNGDPDKVVAMPTVAVSVRMLREAGIRLGVVTNQSGIGRGIISAQDVDRVNRRIDSKFGPFDVWQVCPHVPEDNCRCRKPMPGMILEASKRLGVEPGEIAVFGDIGADVQAALAAGATPVLIPTAQTRVEEVRNAPHVASTVSDAVALLFVDARDAKPARSAAE
jgi:D-glycero-D-manno-heptose 1,7-bisphosphate phosphatase